MKQSFCESELDILFFPTGRGSTSSTDALEEKDKTPPYIRIFILRKNSQGVAKKMDMKTGVSGHFCSEMVLTGPCNHFHSFVLRNSLNSFDFDESLNLLGKAKLKMEFFAS